MPDLPKLTVNQNNYDRLLAAIPGDTLAEKAEFFRKETKRHWTQFVINREQAAKAQEVSEFNMDQA